MKKEVLTYEEAHELLEYRDGQLFWKKSGSGRKVGCRAGFKNTSGYRHIVINGVNYREHRIIFMMHHGYFPEHQVDHINRVRDDNRIENLRHVTNVCNSRNVDVRDDCKSGVTGVAYRTGYTGRPRATITVGGKHLHLGYFDSFDDAVMARWRAEVQHGFPNCNSSSPAYRYLVNNGLIPSGGASC